MTIGFLAVVIAAGIGSLIGLVAGYLGGPLDSILMRITDVFMSIPTLYLILMITAIFGPSTRNTVIVIGIVSWPVCARIVRGQTMSIKSSEFIVAATAQGASVARILFRHFLPNVAAPIVVFASLWAPYAILTEAGLSFLGLGAQPPEPSWGSILSEGRGVIFMAWWMATFPGVMIFLTVLGLNFLGDGLRDALDPKIGDYGLR
ncbi:MAG: ABC transporter permease [Thermaerobacterales bacterium]